MFFNTAMHNVDGHSWRLRSRISSPQVLAAPQSLRQAHLLLARRWSQRRLPSSKRSQCGAALARLPAVKEQQSKALQNSSRRSGSRRRPRQAKSASRPARTTVRARQAWSATSCCSMISSTRPIAVRRGAQEALFATS